jgi:hypothetical protein
MASLAERVQAGIALLEARGRMDWVDINSAVLNIASGRSCVLGQLFGGYGLGLNRLGIGTQGARFGFNRLSADEDEPLNAAWREAIARRRLERAVPAPVVPGDGPRNTPLRVGAATAA